MVKKPNIKKSLASQAAGQQSRKMAPSDSWMNNDWGHILIALNLLNLIEHEAYDYDDPDSIYSAVPFN